MPLPFAATRTALLALLLSSAPLAAAAGGGAAASPLEPTLLEVTVNGQLADEPLMLQRDSSGGLYASEEQLRDWRIRVPSTAPITVDGEAWYRIDNDPRLRAILSAADQTLAIEALPELFEGQTASLAFEEAFEMTPSGTGGFFNYDLFAEYSRGGIAFTGAIEAGAFTRWGVGSTGFILRAGEGGERLVRLDSNWTIDRPDSLSSIRIGDGVSVGGAGTAPLRFGGVQYARNFSTRPGYLTMPLPMLDGTAAVASVVDVYVNNVLQGSRDVRPGPFELTNVPVQSGGGTVQLIVRDLLGRQIVSEQSYYASASLLRRGLHDFSYELGFVRTGYGRSSAGYGAPIASASHRYGVSDSVTLEGHAQLSRGTQAAGAGLVFVLSDIGMIGGSATVSRSGLGTGAFLSGSFERRTMGLSFGVRGEYATADFSFIGMAEENRPARFSTQAFADLPLQGGSIGFNLIHRDRRDGRGEDESLAGLFANVPLTEDANVQIFARRAVAGGGQTVLGAHVAIPLGGRRSASASVEVRGGRIAHNLSYQDDAPSGVGSGYRAQTSLADGRRTVDSAYTYNGAYASLGAHLSRAGGETGVRLSARGSLGLLGGRPFASRQLGPSFARIEVGRHAGVRVYADNQLIGVTGADGSLIVPSLRAFDRNMIRVDDADLPLDVQIGETEVAVRPFARAGAVVRFDARRERGVLLQVGLEDGTDLPAGALVRIEGNPEIFVVASGGEVYLPTLEGTARLEASFAGRTCSFQATVPGGDDPQPRLAGLICRAAATYAAR
ncbi:MAG TPA: fimbria/pilus outer membrane usher protein [Allosphingosinicella sp.]|jgi:outer membrane usher protein